MTPSRLIEITADLHLHTVLSPCAEVEMIPPLIVARALSLGLDLIAVTDHNSAENCAAVMEAAAGTGLAVLPGMEVQTAEEVHVICLFDTVEQAAAWQQVVEDHLPDRPNREAIFGAQYVVDRHGEHLRTQSRLLLASTDLSLDEVVRQVAILGGVAIPAHIDRPAFGLLANLGFVPAGLPVAALELSHSTSRDGFLAQHPELSPHVCLVRGSDAHRLSDMGPTLRLTVAMPSVVELRQAMAGLCGRSFA